MKSQGQIWVFFNVKTQQQSHPMPLAQAQVFVLQMKPHDIVKFVAWTPGWNKWVTLKEIIRLFPKHFPTPPNFFQSDRESTEVIDVKHKRSSRKVRTKSVSGATPDSDSTITHTNTQSKSFNSHPSFTKTGFEHTYTEIALHEQPPNFKDQEFLPEEHNWEKTPIVPILKKARPDSGDERREYRRFPHRIEVVLMTNKGRSFRSSSKNISLGGVMLREPVPSDLLKDVMDIVIVNPFPDEQTPSHLLIRCRVVVGDLKDRRRLVFYDVSPEVLQKLRLILENYKTNYTQFKKKKAG